MVQVLDALTDDKLAHLTDIHKRLLHFVAQGLSDEECARRLRAELGQVRDAVKSIAQIAGVMRPGYEESRGELVRIGKIFFPALIQTSDLKPGAQAEKQPSLNEVIGAILALDDRKRQRLRAYALNEYGDFDAAGKSLGVSGNTIRSEIPNISKEVGFPASYSPITAKKRHKLFREAFSRMENKKPEQS